MDELSSLLPLLTTLELCTVKPTLGHCKMKSHELDHIAKSFRQLSQLIVVEHHASPLTKSTLRKLTVSSPNLKRLLLLSSILTKLPTPAYAFGFGINTFGTRLVVPVSEFEDGTESLSSLEKIQNLALHNFDFQETTRFLPESLATLALGTITST